MGDSIEEWLESGRKFLVNRVGGNVNEWAIAEGTAWTARSELYTILYYQRVLVRLLIQFSSYP